MTVYDGVSWRRDVQLDSVECIGRNPCLGHTQNVKPVVVDDIVDERRLVTS